jgi:hypothetical protein
MVGHQTILSIPGENYPVKSMSADRRTMFAGITLLAASLACSAPAAQTGTETPTQQIAIVITSTPAPTVAVTVPAGVTPTNAPPAPGVTPSATSCLYNSVYVADLTIPDGTEIHVGDSFTKTWRIKNNGCQTWPAGTTLIFVSGNQMNGPASVTVPETAVNGTQDISVTLKAPSPAGDWQGNWQLRTPSGVQFGDKVFVKIKSTAPAAPTATTAPAASIDFTASFVGGIWTCTSGSATMYMYTAILKNTGTVDLKSGNLTLQSPPGTQINAFQTNTPFQSVPTNVDCNAANMLVSTLAPGATGWTSVGINAALPGGDNARLVVRLCTEDDLGGDCKNVRINFTVP